MKTITALGIEEINYEVLKENGYEIIGKDIIYQDGIFEALEIYKSTEAIIISDFLPGNLTFEELIKKIVKKYDKIDITIFLEHDDYNKCIYLNSFGIYKIYSIENYTIEMNNNRNVDNNDKFIEILKNKINSSKMDYINRLPIMNENNSIIVISGIEGGGKTIIACLLAKKLADKGKVLIIDMDSTINGINTITGQEGEFINYKYFDIKNFQSFEDIDNKGIGKETKKVQFYEFLERIKNEYDFIIIDGEKNGTEMQRMLFDYANSIVFVMEPNLISLKKAKSILENVSDEEIQKLKILLNKKSKYSIKNNLLEKIFYRYEIIGYIPYLDQIEYIINKNFNKKLDISTFNDIAIKIIERRTNKWNC